MSVRTAVDRFFEARAPTVRGARMLVAFSGGPDSTVLLHVLRSRVKALDLELEAAHLDHGLDAGSGQRAAHARQLAAKLSVPLTCERREVSPRRRRGESLETAARRVRYEFLHETARSRDARFIATGHHADDQRETVLLRLLYGTGLRGLAAIPPQRGPILRPLLEVEPSAIAAYLAEHRLPAVIDPTNRDLTPARNRMRHLLLPALLAADSSLRQRLPAVAAAARRATDRLDVDLVRRTGALIEDERATCDRRSLELLPSSVRRFAIGSLCRLVEAPPATAAALADVESQFELGGELGCDLGGGWRIESHGETIEILPVTSVTAGNAGFAYTLKVPGEVRLSELALTFRLTRQPVEPWMFRGRRCRAGLVLDLADGEPVTIRTRRPGDRLQPLGCGYRRRLKDLLIDRKMPRNERDRLPLLCVGDTIVWVPGVTIDESARLTDEATVWVAEIERTEA